MVSTRKYDPEAKKKRVVKKEKNEDFVKQASRVIRHICSRHSSARSCVLVTFCVLVTSRTCLDEMMQLEPTTSIGPLQVEKRFPDKSAKLLIGCSNGTQYSLDALEALDEVCSRILIPQLACFLRIELHK